jgi:hypothetical protein
MQLQRLQRQMQELVGEGGDALDVDFDVPASDFGGESEAASTAAGATPKSIQVMRACWATLHLILVPET